MKKLAILCVLLTLTGCVNRNKEVDFRIIGPQIRYHTTPRARPLVPAAPECPPGTSTPCSRLPHWAANRLAS
jgi:hypothetical protein